MRGSILFAGIVAVFAVHCGGSNPTGLESAVDGGGDSGGGSATNPPGCPSAAPSVGAACATESLQCAYGACGVTRRKCTGGAWRDASRGDAPGPGACPSTVPKDGAACDACSLPPSCSYPCTGGASVPTEAICNGTWQVRQGLGPCSGASPCAPLCTPDQLCCEEPTHRVTDAGMPETVWLCVAPASDGTCPRLP